MSEHPALPASLICDLSLRVDDRVQIDVVVDGLGRLGHASNALELRIARVCAWLQRQDLTPAGYTSWASFRREKVAWSDTWTRELIRLV